MSALRGALGWQPTCIMIRHLAGGNLTLPSESSTRVILCIDDDEGVLAYEKSLLEHFGFKILTAQSGREGLTLAMFCKFDLVVLDYLMPGMNGHEVASMMKRIRPELKVVMLSGSEVPAHALASVDAFVAKPDTSQQLLPVIIDLCGTLTSASEESRSH